MELALKELLVYDSHVITEMECLEKNLRLFNAFLKNSRRKEKDEELVRSIRDVVYEVEDVVDAFITCAFEKNSKAGSSVSFLKFWEPSIDLRAIAMNVEELKLKVEQANLNVDDDDDSSEKSEVRPLEEELPLAKFISLSYDNLPYHLRLCFLYLGIFPEDYEISASQLIKMWIGEGFIQQNNNDPSSLEEIAEKYLDDLINRNLVRVVKFKGDGKVKTCQIHDTLRDFCQAENENENFFQEIKYDNGVFAPIKFHKINKDMFRLVHARYIAMSLDSSTLLSKFSELWNIQTLIIDTTSRTLDVKANIWNMSQLRHFKTNASAKLPKPSKDSKHGAELQTLGTISVESCTAEVFDRACNLKKLGIRGRLALLLEGNTGSFDNLGKLKYLERLKLINDVYPLPVSEGHLLGLPQHYQFPKRLRSLTLRATFLTWDYMSILGFLENLEVLKLKDNAFTGRTWNAINGGFRKLVCLYIEHTDLAIWDDVSSHHFPRLRGLVIKDCDKLLGIPLGLAHITSFQTLELYYSASAVASATKIQKLKKEKEAVFKLSIFLR